MKMTHSEAATFYKERDRRTEEYVAMPVEAEKLVCVAIDEAASSTRAGQLILLAMANQLTRVHRRIVFVVPHPEAELIIAPPLVPNTKGVQLGEALVAMCQSIDPFGNFHVQSERPDGAGVAIGIGPRLMRGMDWYVGADRSLAFLKPEPCPLQDEHSGTLRGGALASCLGAAAAFRTVHGMPVGTRTLSAWNLKEDAEASLGPDGLEVTDVGRVLVVGAGAVGAAHVYWLNVFGGVANRWVFVDQDCVELHNANRGLIFGAQDAGWPNGRRTGVARLKAEVAAQYVEGEAVAAWYHEAEVGRERFDVVLALANEHDVRTQIAQRQDAVVLQATTSATWQSQLHRHVVGLDDCVRCRMQDVREVQMSCSTAPVPRGDGRNHDAALPFLSATSGLVLTTALQRLQAAELADDHWNDWRLDFGSAYRMATGGRRRCGEDCEVVRPLRVLRAIHAGRRWGHLIGRE